VYIAGGSGSAAVALQSASQVAFTGVVGAQVQQVRAQLVAMVEMVA
jgi:hypothetical protein